MHANMNAAKTTKIKKAPPCRNGCTCPFLPFCMFGHPPANRFAMLSLEASAPATKSSPASAAKAPRPDVLWEALPQPPTEPWPRYACVGTWTFSSNDWPDDPRAGLSGDGFMDEQEVRDLAAAIWASELDVLANERRLPLEPIKDTETTGNDGATDNTDTTTEPEDSDDDLVLETNEPSVGFGAGPTCAMCEPPPNECVVCFEEIPGRSRLTLVPCGHAKFCDTCAEPMKDCAICRRSVRDRLRIFF